MFTIIMRQNIGVLLHVRLRVVKGWCKCLESTFKCIINVFRDRTNPLYYFEQLQSHG